MILIPIDMKGEGSAKVVGAEQLEVELNGGQWRLVAVLEEEQMVSYCDTAPNPAHNASTYGSVSNLTTTKHEKCKIHRFLISQSKDDVLEEAMRLRSVAESKLQEAMSVQQELFQKNKQLEKLIQDLQTDRNRYETLYNGVRDDLDKKNITVRKMETDISKIRTAVGSVKMKEILEP